MDFMHSALCLQPCVLLLRQLHFISPDLLIIIDEIADFSSTAFSTLHSSLLPQKYILLDAHDTPTKIF